MSGKSTQKGLRAASGADPEKRAFCVRFVVSFFLCPIHEAFKEASKNFSALPKPGGEHSMARSCSDVGSFSLKGSY